VCITQILFWSHNPMHQDQSPLDICDSSIFKQNHILTFWENALLHFVLGRTVKKRLHKDIQPWHFIYLFFNEVRGAASKWLPRAVDFKVSCSQIPRRAFAGIRTHDPGWESDVLTIRPRWHYLLWTWKWYIPSLASSSWLAISMSA
jgi:hypothetical protein